MDKKAWIVITLCVLVMIGYNFYVASLPKPPPAPAPTEGEQPKVSNEQRVEAPSQEEAAPSEDEPPSRETGEVVARKEVTLANEHLRLTLTNHGGGIARAQLLQHFVEASDGGEDMVWLNQYSPYPVGHLNWGVEDWSRIATYEIVESTAKRVVMRTRLQRDIEVEKIYTLEPTVEGEDEYSVHCEIVLRNTGSEPYRQSDLYFYAGAVAPLEEGTWAERYTNFAYYREWKMKTIGLNWFDASRIPLVGIETRGPRESFRDLVDNVMWVGVSNQFFSILVKGDEVGARQLWSKRFYGTETPTAKSVAGALSLPTFTLDPGAEKSLHYSIYLGPKEYTRLLGLGDKRSEIMNFGFFKVISQGLLRLMLWLESLFASYGVAIVLMTFIIRGLMWPLHSMSTRSMKRMALLAPRINELKEKHKDNPQKMNQEMMKLYKEYGINPFGGCLPMLLQLPIFFGFYSMLQSAVELRNEGFLWVSDLSHPDTVATIFGFPINVLPILMGVTMLWQMHVTPKAGDKMQQRIFMFMPVIFLFICYNFASALSLYWTAQNLFSIGQTLIMRSRPDPQLTKKTEAPPTKRKKK